MTKYLQGNFEPKNPGKYQGTLPITYRSSWELRMFRWFDSNPSVLLWNSETLIVPYISPVDGRPHRYFVDLLAKVLKKDGTEATYAIEVKPKMQMLPPKPNKKNPQRFLQELQTYQVNQAKWTAAREFCRTKGVAFLVLNEEDIGITKKK